MGLKHPASRAARTPDRNKRFTVFIKNLLKGLFP
jgi:hypothetical protein